MGIQGRLKQVSRILAFARSGCGMFIQVHLCQGKTSRAPVSHHTLQWLHLITRLQEIITSSMHFTPLLHMWWSKLICDYKYPSKIHNQPPV